jgi:hypothetical protein
MGGTGHRRRGDHRTRTLDPFAVVDTVAVVEAEDTIEEEEAKDVVEVDMGIVAVAVGTEEAVAAAGNEAGHQDKGATKIAALRLLVDHIGDSPANLSRLSPTHYSASQGCIAGLIISGH